MPKKRKSTAGVDTVAELTRLLADLDAQVEVCTQPDRRTELARVRISALSKLTQAQYAVSNLQDRMVRDHPQWDSFARAVVECLCGECRTKVVKVLKGME